MPPLKYWKIKEYLEEVAVRPESATRMPTVRELMKQFNVSLATVNRALSELENDGVIIRRQGSGIVAAGRSRTVKRMAPEENRKNILYAYNDYPDESTWNMVHLIERYTRQLKCNMVDCKIHQDTSTEELIAFVTSQPACAGMILRVGSDLLDRERLEALGRLPIRVVVLDSMYFYADYLPDNVYVISPDGAGCARQMAEHLLAMGHRKIGFVRNEPQSEYTDLYRKTLLATFRKAGIEFGQGQIFSAAIRSWENSWDAAVQVTKANLDEIRKQGLTALIYKSSPGALVAMKTLQEAGFRIPEDVSLIGEGDRALYPYLSPGLSTVSVDFEQMGRTAVEIALGNLTPREHNIFIPQVLIERESVKNLNSNRPEEDK